MTSLKNMSASLAPPEGLEHFPDGQFQPPVPLTCQEISFAIRVKEKLGRTVYARAFANLTKPSTRAADLCHFCGSLRTRLL